MLNLEATFNKLTSYKTLEAMEVENPISSPLETMKTRAQTGGDSLRGHTGDESIQTREDYRGNKDKATKSVD